MNEFLSNIFFSRSVFQYFIVSSLDLFKFVRPKIQSTDARAEEPTMDEHQNVSERHHLTERQNYETSFPMSIRTVSGSGDPAPDQVIAYIIINYYQLLKTNDPFLGLKFKL